jgi:hypothetical protein
MADGGGVVDRRATYAQLFEPEVLSCRSKVRTLVVTSAGGGRAAEGRGEWRGWWGVCGGIGGERRGGVGGGGVCGDGGGVELRSEQVEKLSDGGLRLGGRVHFEFDRDALDLRGLEGERCAFGRQRYVDDIDYVKPSPFVLIETSEVGHELREQQLEGWVVEARACEGHSVRQANECHIHLRGCLLFCKGALLSQHRLPMSHGGGSCDTCPVEGFQFRVRDFGADRFA